MCLFYQNYWAHKLTSEKHLLAYKGDLACIHSRKNLGHNLESSFFFNGYAKINHFIQKHVGRVDPKVEESDFIFNMYFDMTVYIVVILIHDDYELDLSQGSFSDLIGYGKETLSGDSVGRKLPDITRGVDWVFIHCDLITRESNNVPRDVIYSFSTAMLRVSYPFEKNEVILNWHPVNKKIIDSVRIRVTDGIGGALDLNGIDILVNLMIKQE